MVRRAPACRGAHQQGDHLAHQDRGCRACRYDHLQTQTNGTEESINGIVVRPACVYGSSGSYFGDYHFKPALEALEAGKTEFESIISDNGKILTIHQDDAADLFVRVAEAAPAARGEVFLAANPSTDNIRDILDAVVRITGLKGWKAKKASDGESSQDRADQQPTRPLGSRP